MWHSTGLTLINHTPGMSARKSFKTPVLSELGGEKPGAARTARPNSRMTGALHFRIEQRSSRGASREVRPVYNPTRRYPAEPGNHANLKIRPETTNRVRTKAADRHAAYRIPATYAARYGLTGASGILPRDG